MMTLPAGRGRHTQGASERVPATEDARRRRAARKLVERDADVSLGMVRVRDRPELAHEACAMLSRSGAAGCFVT